MSDRDAIIAELPRLRRYARALVGNVDAADDLVQDCLERALSRLHQFRPGSNMRAWLFAIMHGIFVNGVRRPPAAGPLQGEIEQPSGALPEQERGLVITDLEAALARLPAEQREIVLLVGLDDLSYREVAEAVGVPIGTVMSRLARGRERLRVLMDEKNVVLLKKAR